ncbi:MAG: hypothetical protein EPO07_11570 [Verrucomicrobia bacterium]|nr:MAG: hypothetical protein EPO07_11570 [Verrucomicrobiota bacterium]
MPPKVKPRLGEFSVCYVEIPTCWDGRRAPDKNSFEALAEKLVRISKRGADAASDHAARLATLDAIYPNRGAKHLRAKVALANRP